MFDCKLLTSYDLKLTIIAYLLKNFVFALLVTKL